MTCERPCWREHGKGSAGVSAVFGSGDVSAATKYGDVSTTCGSDDAGARHGGGGTAAMARRRWHGGGGTAAVARRRWRHPHVREADDADAAHRHLGAGVAATQRRRCGAARTNGATRERRSNVWTASAAAGTLAQCAGACQLGQLAQLCRRLPLTLSRRCQLGQPSAGAGQLGRQHTATESTQAQHRTFVGLKRRRSRFAVPAL